MVVNEVEARVRRVRERSLKSESVRTLVVQNSVVPIACHLPQQIMDKQSLTSHSSDFGKLQKCLDIVEKSFDRFDPQAHLYEIQCVIDKSKAEYEPSDSQKLKRYRSHLNFINDVLSQGQWHDEEFRNEFEKHLSTVLKWAFGGGYFYGRDAQRELVWIVAESLQRLYKHKTPPSKAVVEKVVSHFAGFDDLYRYDPNEILISAAKHAGCDPSSALMLLSLELEPECSECWDNCYFASTFLDYLVQSHESDKEHVDADRLKVLKYMEVSDMLETEEVQDELCYRLYDCDSNFPQVFDFLCSLDPKVLMHGFCSLENGSCPCHFCSFTRRPCYCDHCSKGNRSFSDFSKLSNYIKAGFKYFPYIGGILFCKDRKGISVLEYALETFGKAKVGKLLRDLLSPKRDFPILHHIFVKAKEHKDLFLQWFPWAYHIRDHNGRTLHQEVIATACHTVKGDAYLFATLTETQLKEKDPVTMLYLFAASAVGKRADLNTCFLLLSRQPSVLESSRPVGLGNNKRKRLASV